MAWENVNVTIFGIPQSYVNDFSWCDNPQNSSDKVTANGLQPQYTGFVVDSYAWGNDVGLSLRCVQSANQNRFEFQGWKDGAYYSPMSLQASGIYKTDTGGISFICCINRETQKGILCFIGINPTTGVWGWYAPTTAGGNAYQYELIMANIIIPYNWVSVPSVTGKNGIISLAQIASDSINDGEPVSDAAATAFSDLPAECNVGEIIDELLPYEESLVDVLVKYKVKGAVTGAFEYVKLVAKKGSIPKSVEDGDKVVDINPSKKSKLVTGLDEGSKYYFVIFEKDSAGQTAQSNEKSIRTGDLPDGTIFEYTGSIQAFTAPKTGIYQLETWGAQGGDASDGTLTARGGYGAYAVGEVLLQQGDTLYINVGGQNGYGGGGNYTLPNNE